jgi:lysine-specific demethylase 8
MATAAPSPQGETIPVTSLENWAKIAEECHRNAKPVLIPGGNAGARTHFWTPEFFAREYPNLQVPVSADLPRHGVPYSAASQMHQRTMAAAEFVNLLRQRSPCYMNQVPLKLFPALLREFDTSRLRVTPIRALNVWVGASTRSGLHFDSADNMFAQMYGAKRVILISPRYSRRLYPFEDNPSKSQVDPENPDLERFPRFANCPRLECDLQPGDLLYIPRGWWHFLAADEVSISVNCWHGRSLKRRERWRSFAAAGPGALIRWIRDFVWHGMLRHPYQNRLFSPPPLGVQSFRRLRDQWAGFKRLFR